MPTIDDAAGKQIRDKLIQREFQISFFSTSTGNYDSFARGLCENSCVVYARARAGGWNCHQKAEKS